MTIPTVRIASNETEQGFIIVNETDLQPDDVLFDADGAGELEDDVGAAVADMTIKQLREFLKAQDVPFESSANKAALLELALALPAA